MGRFAQFAVAATRLALDDADLSITAQNSEAAELDLHGPAMTMSAECGTGLDAIYAAYVLITSGKLTIALAGGSDAPIVPETFAAFCAVARSSIRREQAAAMPRSSSPATTRGTLMRRHDGQPPRDLTYRPLLEDVGR